ncbi:hypothetical protein CTI12_AA596650 [Artemisia annua]|uniref:Pierisin-like domain-containing protein n=1 Tax=Artemisia annua TaxID=35608 RepID=A0A2U1KJ65_ARTAN|nr:hypothetical protein CTI12_AA596650 [Artemisia annua]
MATTRRRQIGCHIGFDRWNTVTQPLSHIMFRGSLGDMDSCSHVYRWDRKPYQLVFVLGFEARHQANTQVESYFNLESYVNSGGRPLDPIRDTTYGFISTTHTASWYVPIVSRGVVEHPYRYEIYASEGIDVHETLGERYFYPAQAEIVFPVGIVAEKSRLILCEVTATVMGKWNTVTQPLSHIMFRGSLGDMDSCSHVYRWDRKPYQLVFVLGFEARHQANTQVESYFNLESYVNSGGRPLDPIRDTTYGFISTTHTASWYVPIVSRGVVEHPYRYEIYASEGIDVHETLGERYFYPAQAEIVFPVGIAPQYI